LGVTARFLDLFPEPAKGDAMRLSSRAIKVATVAGAVWTLLSSAGVVAGAVHSLARQLSFIDHLVGCPPPPARYYSPGL